MNLITPSKAAKLLGINKRTLYRWEMNHRIRVKREGVLNVRVYDENYIKIVKKIVDLNKEEKEHLAKLPEIRNRVREHLFVQDAHALHAGEPMKFMDIEKANNAFYEEEKWLKEHQRILNDLFSYQKDIIREVLQPD